MIWLARTVEMSRHETEVTFKESLKLNYVHVVHFHWRGKRFLLVLQLIKFDCRDHLFLPLRVNSEAIKLASKVLLWFLTMFLRWSSNNPMWRQNSTSISIEEIKEWRKQIKLRAWLLIIKYFSNYEHQISRNYHRWRRKSFANFRPWSRFRRKKTENQTARSKSFIA